MYLAMWRRCVPACLAHRCRRGDRGGRLRHKTQDPLPPTHNDPTHRLAPLCIHIYPYPHTKHIYMYVFVTHMYALTGADGEAEEAVGRAHGEEAGGDLPPRGVAHQALSTVRVNTYVYMPIRTPGPVGSGACGIAYRVCMHICVCVYTNQDPFSYLRLHMHRHYQITTDPSFPNDPVSDGHHDGHQNIRTRLLTYLLTCAPSSQATTTRWYSGRSGSSRVGAASATGT